MNSSDIRQCEDCPLWDDKNAKWQGVVRYAPKRAALRQLDRRHGDY